MRKTPLAIMLLSTTSICTAFEMNVGQKEVLTTAEIVLLKDIPIGEKGIVGLYALCTQGKKLAVIKSAPIEKGLNDYSTQAMVTKGADGSVDIELHIPEKDKYSDIDIYQEMAKKAISEIGITSPCAKKIASIDFDDKGVYPINSVNGVTTFDNLIKKISAKF